MISESLYSSASEEWSTPQWLFDEYNNMYRFKLDVCATKENAKCEKFYTKEDDGLKQPWPGNWWCNPPYGRGVTGLWVKKAFEERGGVMLIPARTDTKWFHDYIYRQQGVEIRFLKGRLKFGDSKNSAPFPSMIIIWSGK